MSGKPALDAQDQIDPASPQDGFSVRSHIPGDHGLDGIPAEQLAPIFMPAPRIRDDERFADAPVLDIDDRAGRGAAEMRSHEILVGGDGDSLSSPWEDSPAGGLRGLFQLRRPKQRPFAPGPAVLAKAEEFDVMVPDQESVFLGQNIFGLTDEVELFFLEITVIQDLTAGRTDEVMVVVALVALFVFKTHLAVSRQDPSGEPGLIQKLKRPIDGGQTDLRMGGMEQSINLFGAQVLLGLDKDIEDLFAGHRPTATMIP